jgi:excisionase family DNA binding protein
MNQTGDAMEKSLLRVGEAAQMLNVSRWTIYRWVEEGRLEATKLNKGSLRVFRASLAALVADNRMHDDDVTGSTRASSPRGRFLLPTGR